MVTTRSSERRKGETAFASMHTHPPTDTTHQEHPRRCPETGPHPFPALWSSVGNIKKACTSSYILRPAMRVVNKPLPVVESQPQTSSPTSKLENHVPYTLDDVDMELVSQFQEAHQADQADPHVEETRPAKSSQCTSLNITEFATRLQDNTDDDLDEVLSPLDPAFVFVYGHKVKKEHGPLLNAIFDKYGDIATESKGKLPAIVSFFLERTCAIFERLKEAKFSKLTRKDLNEMLDEVGFLESQKLKLGWLREKLEYIHNTKTSFDEYLTTKEEGKKSEMMIANLRKERLLIQEKLSAEMVKSERIKKRECDIKKGALDNKARVDYLSTHSLVDGLL